MSPVEVDNGKLVEIRSQGQYEHVNDPDLKVLSRYAVTVEYQQAGFRSIVKAHVRSGLNEQFGEGAYSLEVVSENAKQRFIEFDLLVDTEILINVSCPNTKSTYLRGDETAVTKAFEDHTTFPSEWRPLIVMSKGTAIYRKIEQKPETPETGS